jgi:uncharacterized tellurite resistance protein B-like protein
MLARILSLLKDPPPATADTVGAPFERRQLAVAALLLEIAQRDRNVASEELETIGRILRKRFGIDASIAERLIKAARIQLDASLEDWIFASAVREGFSTEERVAIVSMLWEVVYVDGGLAHLEETLMRRLSEELGIGEAEAEAARAQAFARVGLQRGAAPNATEAE